MRGGSLIMIIWKSGRLEIQASPRLQWMRWAA